MVRRTPQGLGGPIQITPVATPQDTFVQGSTQRITSGEIIDFTPFSKVLAGYVGEKEEEARDQTALIAYDIGKRQASGEDLEEILKEYSESGDTLTRTKTKLAKAFNAQGIDPTANPAYLVQYHRGQGSIKALAARGEILRDENIMAFAKAGAAAPAGQANQAMLGAIRGKLDEMGIYKDLDAFGRAAVDEQLTGIFGEALQASEALYTQEVKTAVRETFGGNLLVLGRQAAQAIKDGRPEQARAAIESMGNYYTEYRGSGEPDHRNHLATGVLAILEDVNSTDGPEVTVELAEDLIENLGEGPHKLLNAEAKDDSADLQFLSTVLQAKESYANSIERYKSKKSAEWAEKKAEIHRQMGAQHGAATSMLITASPQKINEYYNNAIQALYQGTGGEEDFFADSEALFIQQEWLQEQRNRTLQQQSVQAYDDEKIKDSILLDTAQGNTDRALETLNDVNGTGLLTGSTMAKLFEEVNAVRQTPQVFQSSAFQNIDTDIYRALSGLETFLLPGTNQADSTKLDPIVRYIAAKIREDITQMVAADGDAIRQDNPAVWVRKTADELVGKYTETYTKIDPTKNAQQQVDAQIKAKTFEEQVGSAVTPVPTLGELKPEEQPRVLSRVTETLSRPITYNFAETLLGTSGLGTGKAARESLASSRIESQISTVADHLDNFLADPDITDTRGIKITPGQKSRAVAESIAYTGLTMNELIGGKLAASTVAKWATEDREALTKEIAGKRLDFSGVDLLNTPVEEAVQLLPFIIFDPVTGSPTGLRKVDPDLDIVYYRLQTLLPKFGLPADDKSLLSFVKRQYDLLSTLRPETYKKR